MGNRIKAQSENPKGLHRRYFIQKIVGEQVHRDFFDNPYYTPILKPVDKEAEYFIMRLDTGGSDIEHIKACRIGIHAYADAVQYHLPKLAKELKERYPLL